MAAVVIPAGTLAVGTLTVGPFAVPNGWRTVVLDLDIVQVGSLDCVVEWSPDGLPPWQSVAEVRGITGPGASPSAVLRCAMGDGMLAAQVRATLINQGLPFVTTGGSLQVS